MSIIGDTRFVERNQFFNGQRLFASDLQGVEELNRQMRWLHNQSLHQPGIGAGFAISGNKGDRQVVIQPGYAIDAEGREIVLTETAVEPVPPVAGDDFGGPVYFDLTVSYPDEHTLNAAETREGVCGAARGAIRLREAPVFCWVRLGAPPDQLPTDKTLSDAVVKGLHLRLARAQVLNCKLDRPLSLAQRRNAKPPEQPYVACGRPESLAWAMSTAPAALGFGLQLSATVDTASAGFRTAPSYSAVLRGDRLFTFQVEGKTIQRVLDGFVSLFDLKAPQNSPEAKGRSKREFTFSVLIPDSLFMRVPETDADPNPTKTDPAFQAALVKQANDKWSVDWIGVEG